MNRRIILAAACAASLLPLPAWTAEVTTKDVRRFLDPTVMITRLEYGFQANYLPGDTQLYTNRLRPWYAISGKAAVWVGVPYLAYSFPDRRTRGLGDVSYGGGIVTHENLTGRITASALTFDLVTPTGSPAKGTGLGIYRGEFTGALVTNPTDLFPVYWIARYNQSFEKTASGNDIRALDFTLRTFHILPKGFYVLFIPSLLFDFVGDFDVFSFGLGSGRAITKRFSVSAAYVQYISGRETFNRGFNIGLHTLFGSPKGR